MDESGPAVSSSSLTLLHTSLVAVVKYPSGCDGGADLSAKMCCRFAIICSAGRILPRNNTRHTQLLQ